MVTTAVTTLFFGPSLIAGHGIGIAPWWLAVAACIAQGCRGPDVRFYLAVFVIAPALLSWACLLLIGLAVRVVRG